MRHRILNPVALLRRVAPPAVLAGILAGALLAPNASAGPAENAVFAAYINGGGNIPSCKFSKSALTSLRNVIPADADDYAQDLRAELNNEIARWTSGGCSNSGGSNGGQQVAAYRAVIKSLKVAKNRRTVKVKLRCPIAALAKCKVTLSGRLAGKKAAKKRTTTVAIGKPKTIKMTLTRSARKRLRTKGGKLKISAKTTGSTLAASTRSVKFAPPA
jgi:hypothetical protein